MLLTSFFYYTVWLTVVKTLKFTLWPDLNLTAGLDIRLTSYQTFKLQNTLLKQNKSKNQW